MFCTFLVGQIDLLVKEQRLRLLACFWRSRSVRHKLYKVVGFGGRKSDINAGYREVRPSSDDLNIAHIFSSFNTHTCTLGGPEYILNRLECFSDQAESTHPILQRFDHFSFFRGIDPRTWGTIHVTPDFLMVHYGRC